MSEHTTGSESTGPEILIAGQIRPEQMDEIKGHGVRSIICNRPDGEEPGQPDYAEIEAAAQAAGLEIRYIPVYHDRPDPDLPQRFADAVAELPQPVLAYCRSGARSNALAQAASAL
jgi:sulfide:quinone oxidoreductase